LRMIRLFFDVVVFAINLLKNWATIMTVMLEVECIYIQINVLIVADSYLHYQSKPSIRGYYHRH